MTLSVAAARDNNRAEPVYLVEIQLKNGGPMLYFATRNIIVAGQIYEDYIDAISGLGSQVKRADSSFMNSQTTIQFSNDRYRTYGRLIEIAEDYPFTTADCTIKELYLDAAGNQSAVETVDSGKLDSPKNIDKLKFSCQMSNRLFVAGQQW